MSTSSATRGAKSAKLEGALHGVKRLGVDTQTLIYYIQQMTRWAGLVDYVFQQISDGNMTGIVSTVTLLEKLTLPLCLGNSGMATQYRDVITDSANLECLPLTADIAEEAAGLRARYHLRTPDAIVAATAIAADCEAILTNDSRIACLSEIRVITLNDYRADKA